MTVVAIWCRHQGDNVIGVGGEIPWRVESDTQRFREIVDGQTVVVGRKTYESLPNRTIKNSRIYVLSSDTAYEVSDLEAHQVINGQKVLADVEDDLYVAGGAEIYHLFLAGKEKLKPQIIIDCVYLGDLREMFGEHAVITDSVEIMEKKYRRVSLYPDQDDVSVAIWMRKGEFVEQSVLKRIITILEKNMAVNR